MMLAGSHNNCETSGAYDRHLVKVRCPGRGPHLRSEAPLALEALACRHDREFAEPAVHLVERGHQSVASVTVTLE